MLYIFGKTWLYIVLHNFNLTYYSSIILGSFSILLFPKLCWHIGLTPTTTLITLSVLSLYTHTHESTHTHTYTHTHTHTHTHKHTHTHTHTHTCMYISQSDGYIEETSYSEGNVAIPY